MLESSHIVNEPEARASVLAVLYICELLGSYMSAILVYWTKASCLSMLCHLYPVFVVLLIMHCFGHISGAHANPNITLACILTNSMPWWVGLKYLCVQFVGAFLGLLTLRLSLPELLAEPKTEQAKQHEWRNGHEQICVYLREFVCSYLMLVSRLGIWHNKNPNMMSGWYIRLACILMLTSVLEVFYGEISMNIALTLCSHLLLESKVHISTFILAQMAAIILAVTTFLYYKYIYLDYSDYVRMF